MRTGPQRAGTLNPYEAGVATLPCPWLDAVSPIWRDTPAPYGPLFVLIAAVAVMLGGSLTAVIVILRLLALAGVLAIAACLPVLARRCGMPVERALWVALAGPLVGSHLVGGPHNDALMIAAVVAGLALLVIGARSPALQLAAGAVLGLAVAIKITAVVVVVPFAVLIAVRRPARGGLARFAKFPGAPLMTILLVVVVVHHLRRVALRPPESRNRVRQPDPAGSGALTTSVPADRH